MTSLSDQLQHAFALQQRGNHAESISVLKKLLKTFPKEAQVPWLIGVAYLHEKDLTRSENYLKKARKLKHDDANVLNSLGMLKLEQKDYRAAYEFFSAAYASQANDISLLGNLSLAASGMGEFELAISHAKEAYTLSGNHQLQAFKYANALSGADHFNEAINVLKEVTQSSPRYLEAWMNLGNNLKIKGRFEEAKKAYESALKLDEHNAGVKFNLGLLLLREAESARGWQLYEARRELVEFQDKNLQKLNAPYWQGEDLTGKTLLIYSEQGRGDTLHYCRYLAWVKARGAATTVLYGDPKMQRLFNSLVGLDDWVNEGDKLPKHHYRVSIMSLPSIYFSLADTHRFMHPYLSASDESVMHWRDYFASRGQEAATTNLERLRVGIVWQGNPGFLWDRYRSIPLVELSPIIEDETLDIISVQVFDPTKQLASFARVSPQLAARIDDPTDNIRRRGAYYDDTAGLLSQLDAVITTDTSMTHLCGALGVKTFLLQGAYSDWRYGTDEKQVPDYPSMSLCREDDWHHWSSAVHKAHGELRAMRSA